MCSPQRKADEQLKFAIPVLCIGTGVVLAAAFVVSQSVTTIASEDDSGFPWFVWLLLLLTCCCCLLVCLGIGLWVYREHYFKRKAVSSVPHSEPEPERVMTPATYPQPAPTVARPLMTMQPMHPMTIQRPQMMTTMSPSSAPRIVAAPMNTMQPHVMPRNTSIPSPAAPSPMYTTQVPGH